MLCFLILVRVHPKHLSTFLFILVRSFDDGRIDDNEFDLRITTNPVQLIKSKLLQSYEPCKLSFKAGI